MKKKKTEEKKGKVIRKERRTGRFMRSFNLGTDIQDKDIEANFVNGLLTLKAPKSKALENKTRKIAIK